MVNVFRRRTSCIAGVTALGSTLLSGIGPEAKAAPSNVTNIPSTAIYDQGTLHLDVDYLRIPVGTQTFNFLSSGLTYGLGPGTDKPFGRTEIGFDAIISQSGGNPDFGDRFSANIKTQLYNDSQQGVRVVIGGYSLGNLGSQLGYIIGSKDLGEAGLVQAGFQHAFNDDFGGNKNSFIIGYQKALGEKILLGVDYTTGKNLGALTVGANYFLSDKVGIQVGVFRPNESFGSSKYFYYAGLDFNFRTGAGGISQESRNKSTVETAPNP